MKKWLIGGALVFLVFFVALPAAGAYAYFQRFYAPIPALEYPEPSTPAEARLQDVDALAQYTNYDNSFSADELKAFNAHVATLRETAPGLSEPAFRMEVAKAIAITRNGHSNLSLRDLTKGIPSLPVRFSWFDEGLYIVRAHEAHADLIGKRVTSYDGKDPEVLLEELMPYRGGNASFVRFDSPIFLARPALLHAAGLAPSPGSVTLTLEDEAQPVVLEALDTETRYASAYEAALPYPVKAEEESPYDWKFLPVPLPAQTPFAAEPETVLRLVEYGESGALIRLREVWGEMPDGTPLPSALKSLAKKLKENPQPFLIIDMRNNGGGDLTMARSFAQDVKSYVQEDGRIYILVNEGTFSAAIVTAAFLRDAAGEAGEIVGSPMGDDETFWAEGGGAVTLPNSGLRLRVSTGYHDWQDGCTTFRDCYWLCVVMGVAAGPLDPTIPAPLRYADYIRGVDTGVQTILYREGVTDIPGY